MLTQPRFKVYLNSETPGGDVTEHEVTITHQDQLRAEQMGARMGLPPINESPMTATTLWVWAALKREGVLDVKPGEFLNIRCAGLEKAGGADDAVDPTQPDPDTGLL